MAWKDITSYSRGQSDRTPTTWEVSAGPVRVVVTSSHRANPGFWTMHCTVLGIDTMDMKLPSDVDPSIAQSAAINIAAARVRELAKALEKASLT